MATENALSRAGFEGPVLKAEDDRYGYTAIAEGLARSISALDENVSTVIGIEGQWGSGKTSLLNLLTDHLKSRVPTTTEIVVFSPWVNSPDESPVNALMMTIAARLAKLDKSAMAQAGKLAPLTENILNYAQQTSRRLAPVTRFAGNFVPGLGLVADGMDALAETGLSGREKTAAELRADIEDKIAGLGVSFIVVIDDLDRLEPAQAVEVLRMVRSVADFSRFRYVMCYDRDVLAHAVETGLGVQNGKLYLQKIIPLSFSLPRPESFDLRREFIAGVVRLYTSVCQTEPDEMLLQDLRRVADIYGTALRTPREVQLTLNALAFRYSGLRDYVWLPDLCFLLLIRTVNPDLYDWTEHYLTERAVVESGDGTVSEAEQAEMVSSLGQYLSLFRSSEAKSATSLHHWVPGISGYKIEHLKLFIQADDDTKSVLTANRRLGSAAYWRYYFAYSSPQNVLPPDYFRELFRKAGNPAEHNALAEELLSRINSNNISSRTWFEHILSQLTWPAVASRTTEQCAGLLAFFFEHGDDVIERYTARNEWFAPDDLDTKGVAIRLLQKICEDTDYPLIDFLGSLLENGKAWRWIADFFRQLLWMHGLVGDRTEHLQHFLLRTEDLLSLQLRLASRLNAPNITCRFEQGELFLSYIWAWCDISGLEHVRAWFKEMTREDEHFLRLLLTLRYRGVSSSTGPYRALSLVQAGEFIGEAEQISRRLDQIEQSANHAELLSQVKEAITRNRF
ncbi:KAP family P-loop NTPase fold protein [Klebsiella michiganensis]|uniref:KAP family P-loop NTPase fold protein n=1 Tax=Klebsiella michiganensis TaxID=1134687 RepID=UPI00224667DE|nr:P-loop NTPase fold protein [Klebsiella michiganensis]MCW9490367.1 P-loop NTPase fold protein [Klebsiella michiganensis]